MRTQVTAILAFLSFCAPLAADSVVYEGMGTPISSYLTTEVGDTVTLAGTARFITELAFSVSVSAGDIGKNDLFRVRLYLPNSSGYPERLIWQSAPQSVALSTTVQEVAVTVPNIRVPNTFIWCAEHGSSLMTWFNVGGTPTIGSSASYAWVNMTKRASTNLMARIKAVDRPDAILLGKATSSGSSGIGSAEKYTMKCDMLAAGLDHGRGPTFAGLTATSVGTFPSLAASDYSECTAILTNGQNDDITLYGASGGNTLAEQSRFTKSSGIATGYPDFFGCWISDIVLAVNNIVVDHSTPGWTYYTWNVTWEIWGVEMRGDLNKDGKVNGLDHAVLANQWFATGSGLGADVSGPSGPRDGIVNAYDLMAVSGCWLKDAKDPSTW